MHITSTSIAPIGRASVHPASQAKVIKHKFRRIVMGRETVLESAQTSPPKALPRNSPLHISVLQAIVLLLQSSRPQT
jgi:hypothetical protein